MVVCQNLFVSKRTSKKQKKRLINCINKFSCICFFNEGKTKTKKKFTLPLFLYNLYFFQWYGGDFLCKSTKAISTFALHLTANMQVLIAADRLYITAHLRDIKQVFFLIILKITFQLI